MTATLFHRSPLFHSPAHPRKTPAMNRITTTLQASAAAVAFAALAPAQAAIYAVESFDYAAGSSIVGQNGGTGFASAWSFAGPGAGTTQSIVPGLSIPGLDASGNALQIVGDATPSDTTRDSGIASRTFGADTASSSDLWVSYLIRQIEDNTPDSFGANNGSTFGTHFNEQAAPNRDFIIRPKSSGGFDSTHDAVIGTFKDPLATDEDFNLLDDITYMIVAKFAPIDYPAFTGTTTDATLWVLNPADVADLLNDGISETSLDDHNQTSITGSVTPTFGIGGLDSSDVLNVLAYNGTAQFDELRYGMDIDDVIVVPEPGAFALAALGGLAALQRRRSV